MTRGVLRRLAVALGWLMVAAIVALSLGPAPDTGLEVPYEDKWGHLLAYGSLMGWFALLYRGWPARSGYLLGFLLLGIGLELIQSQVAGREGSAADVLANLTGLGLGLALSLPIGRRFPNWGWPSRP